MGRQFWVWARAGEAWKPVRGFATLNTARSFAQVTSKSMPVVIDANGEWLRLDRLDRLEGVSDHQAMEQQ